MVLGLDGEPLLAGIEGRSARHRPRFQDAVALQAEIVMQPARRMLLDDEQQRPVAARAHRGRRLRGDGERALGRVFGEAAFRHAAILEEGHAR
jgi:hypothetical protein